VLSSQPVGSIPLYRLYNFGTGRHYYTLNGNERTMLLGLVPPTSPDYGKAGWRDEGIEGYMFLNEQPTTTRIYRLYNTTTGTHLFTESQSMRDAILAQFPGIWVEHSALGYAFAVAAGASAIALDDSAPPASSLATAEQAAVLPTTLGPSASGDSHLATMSAVGSVTPLIAGNSGSGINAGVGTTIDASAPVSMLPLVADAAASAEDIADADSLDAVFASLDLPLES
jgi:hypothetical protein